MTPANWSGYYRLLGYGKKSPNLLGLWRSFCRAPRVGWFDYAPGAVSCSERAVLVFRIMTTLGLGLKREVLPAHQARIKCMNSARVRASCPKLPRMALVTVVLFCF